MNMQALMVLYNTGHTTEYKTESDYQQAIMHQLNTLVAWNATYWVLAIMQVTLDYIQGGPN